MRWRTAIAAVILVAAGAATASAAATRAEYVAQTDPICQAGQRDMRAESKRQNPATKEIRRQLEQEELTRERENALLGKLAAKEFAPTLKVFPRVTTQIAAVAPAPTDVTAVSQWLAARRAYADLIKRAVEVARRGASKKQNFLIEKATGKIVEGEIPVEGFGFRFCILSSPQD
jgi:hypothetical protein